MPCSSAEKDVSGAVQCQTCPAVRDAGDTGTAALGHGESRAPACAGPRGPAAAAASPHGGGGSPFAVSHSVPRACCLVVDPSPLVTEEGNGGTVSWVLGSGHGRSRAGESAHAQQSPCSSGPHARCGSCCQEPVPARAQAVSFTPTSRRCLRERKHSWALPEGTKSRRSQMQ